MTSINDVGTLVGVISALLVGLMFIMRNSFVKKEEFLASLEKQDAKIMQALEGVRQFLDKLNDVIYQEVRDRDIKIGGLKTEVSVLREQLLSVNDSLGGLQTALKELTKKIPVITTRRARNVKSND